MTTACRILLLLLLVLFTACQKKETTVAASPKPATKQTPDTITNTIDVRNSESTDSVAKTDTAIVTNGVRYHVITSARLLKEKEYRFTAKYLQNNVPHRDTLVGFDAAYSFSATEGNKKLFTTTLHKKDFEENGDGTVLAEAYIDAPYLLQYIPSFKCFLFGLNIFVPDSDVGGQLLVLINRDGSVKKILYNNTFGGGGCDGPDYYVAPDGSYIAFNYFVLHKDGTITDLYINPGTIVARRQVNPETLLVVDEYSETDNNVNARLVTPYGKNLKTFTYKGGYDMLGFTLPSYEDKTTLYLLERKGALRIIPRKTPLQTTLVKAASILPSDNKKPKPTEKAFKIEDQTDVLHFLHDTISNTFRMYKE